MARNTVLMLKFSQNQLWIQHYSLQKRNFRIYQKKTNPEKLRNVQQRVDTPRAELLRNAQIECRRVGPPVRASA